MVAISRFEDIEAWKTARELAKYVYQISTAGSFGKDYGLRDQIQRAVTSIMANIAEGFDGRSDKEFAKFLIYAIRSASEVQSHLYVALDQGYISGEQFEILYDRTVQVKNLTNGFLRYIRSRPHSESKASKT